MPPLEPRHQPLLPLHRFAWRMARFFAWFALLLGVSLGIGMLGYHQFESLGWLDSLLNASMLLGGMGPIESPGTTAGKYFASFYSLFSGVVFLVGVGVLITPIAHRIFHKFHLDMDAEQRRRAQPPKKKSKA